MVDSLLETETRDSTGPTTGVQRQDAKADEGATVSRAPSPTPKALRVYVQALLIAGAIVLAHSAVAVVGTPHPVGWLVFAGLAIVAGSFKLNFATVSASISVADTFFITMAVMFGPGPAAVAVAVDSLVISCRRHDPWVRVAFNTSAPALSLWVGAQAFFALAGGAPVANVPVPIVTLIAPLLTLAAIYFLLNSGLTAIAVGLESRQSPLQLWRRHFQWLWIGYFAAASVAFCLILLIQQASLAAVVMLLPLLAVFHLTLRSSFGRLDDAHRHLSDMDRLYLSTVETLAMAIDAKDDVTHSHVRRVQAYSVGLARALGITDEVALKALKAAALLHDTGKLGVPEHILNKPGRLTAAEFDKMKLHVDIGADILSLVQFPYPVVPIVRCHHESWNGSGYPRGVAGEDIPIGARILSVVDCFDALTSDRPYRRRLSDEASIQILRERSGTMYDPRVVETFIRVYRDIEVEQDAPPAEREVLQRLNQARTETDAAIEPSDVATAAPADLLAFVSLARLVSGDGRVADVLALASKLLRELVPAASGAWYVPDTGDRLIVADAFGPAAGALRGMSVDVGDRLTGWVAASGQPIMNSDAALDLGARVNSAGAPLRSCMSVPITNGSSVVAVLSLYAESADAFSADHCRVVQMIAPHLASALQAAGPRASSVAQPTLTEKAGGGSQLRLVAAR
jgi:putative nucleotidyltransferase with HDIG domain